MSKKRDEDLWQRAPISVEELQENMQRLFDASAFHDWYKPHAQYGMSEWPESLARQEFADECDINTIMRRYETGEEITHVARTPPMYLDYASVPGNLMDAMAFMQNATSEFMRLPAHVRREFDNDPGKFVAFAENPANLDQMRAWDLAPKPPEQPAQVPAAQASPASPGAPAASPAPGGAAPTQ